jgi:hypothetical protein
VETAKVETAKPETVKTETPTIPKTNPEVQPVTVATNTGNVQADTGTIEQSATGAIPEIANSGGLDQTVSIPLVTSDPSTQG